MLLSALEIKDFATLSMKALRMESVIQEKNKFRDRKISKREAFDAVTNVGFKRPRDIKCYYDALMRESRLWVSTESEVGAKPLPWITLKDPRE